MYYDVQAESSVWLFKPPLAGDGAATQLVYKAVVTTTIRLQFDYRSTTVRLQFDLDDHSMTVGLSVCAAALRPQ